MEAGAAVFSLSSEDSASALPEILIGLLKGVQYQENDPKRWNQLLNLSARVRDFVTVLGLELILDEAEGYAFLRSREEVEDPDAENPKSLPRLVARRPLSFPVSLLLALLRKKLAEFDAGGAETRLVLSRDQIVELIQVFMPASSNEAKLVSQVERHINKVVDLGFLRPLKQDNTTRMAHYEVRRIIKAFVDAQWLSEFDRKLEQYQQHLAEGGDE